VVSWIHEWSGGRLSSAEEWSNDGNVATGWEGLDGFVMVIYSRWNL